MPNLITRERALRNLATLTPTEAEVELVDELLAVSTRVVQSHCQRTFSTTRYDELHPGSSRPELILRNYPVCSVERVAYAPKPVLRIRNTASTNHRATGAVRETGLVLTRVASGVTHEDVLPFASSPTLLALSDAINAVGEGWSATLVDAGDGARASTDLRSLQGAFFAKDVDADLRVHAEELTDFDIDAEQGCILLPRSGFVDGLGSVWNGGGRYWRVIYTAGFDPVPEDVQEACAQVVAAFFWQSRRDPGLSQESLSGAFSRTTITQFPGTVPSLLRPYRTRRL